MPDRELSSHPHDGARRLAALVCAWNAVLAPAIVGMMRGTGLATSRRSGGRRERSCSSGVTVANVTVRRRVHREHHQRRDGRRAPVIRRPSSRSVGNTSRIFLPGSERARVAPADDPAADQHRGHVRRQRGPTRRLRWGRSGWAARPRTPPGCTRTWSCRRGRVPERDPGAGFGCWCSARMPAAVVSVRPRDHRDLGAQGGFPPLMLDPIDFVALYQQRMGAAVPRRRRNFGRRFNARGVE